MEFQRTQNYRQKIMIVMIVFSFCFSDCVKEAQSSGVHVTQYWTILAVLSTLPLLQY